MSKDKKRKHNDSHHSASALNGTSADNIDTSKPTATFTPTGSRLHTLTLALPGSIIANAKSHDAKTALCGTIARALAVFCVDEVVVFNDEPVSSSTPEKVANDREGYTALSDPNHFLAHVLTYLETPPHLRKALFPMHPNLRTAGTLPSLDMPHHLRASEWCEHREGVTMRSSREGTEVDVGLTDTYLVRNVQIPQKTRVTVRLTQETKEAVAVSPAAPREQNGYYWGYSVRRCSTLSDVFTECPFDGGYDLSVGMSERGEALEGMMRRDMPKYQHMLVVLGGVAGLETAARNDAELAQRGIKGSSVNELFDYWVNLLPGQGSRTIRTEEAVWCGLMGLQGVIRQNSTGRGIDQRS